MTKYLLGGMAIALVLMGLAVRHYRAEYIEIYGQFEAFKAVVKANGERAEAEKLAKEKENATKIRGALRDRDAALAKLRDEGNRPPSSLLPEPAPATPEPSRIRFDRAELDGAIQSFRSGVQSLIVEGDKAVIDNKAWAESWPK